MLPGSGKRGVLLGTLPWILTLGVALLHLPFPFDGDQAFTLAAARALERGGTLYVDWWDIRQPGEVWFFLAAGRLFGFTEVGVHLLEFAWMSATAILVTRLAAELTTCRSIAGWASWFTVGVYYAYSSSWELTQAEALVALPLACCLLIVIKDHPAMSPVTTAVRWIVFGAAAAVVTVFKLLLVVIPGSMALVALVMMMRHGSTTALALRRVIPAVVGFGAVIGSVVAHFWWREAVDALYWTTFVAPVLSLAEIPRAPYHRLLTSAGWYVSIWLPAVALIGLGILARPRSKQTALIVAWVVAAAAAILLQRFHYWPYHFLLFMVPTGLLAVKGLDAGLEMLGAEAGRRRWAAAVLIGPALATSLAVVGPRILAAYDAMASGHPAADRFRSLVSPTYAAMREVAGVIREPAARPGSIFVFGDPQILALSDRPQAIPLRGWALSGLLQRQWDEFPELIQEHRPTYIFVATADSALLEKRSPKVNVLLRSLYRPYWTGAAGRWYERVAE